MSKCMNYISGMVVKMGVALLREALAVNYWVIIYCLEVSCKGGQITSTKWLLIINK